MCGKNKNELCVWHAQVTTTDKGLNQSQQLITSACHRTDTSCQHQAIGLKKLNSTHNLILHCITSSDSSQNAI